MGQIVMLRHGQSEWNKKNLFTGWVDIPLSQEGIEESISAGHKIAHMSFDIVFVSDLARAQMTLFLAMSVNKAGKTPVLLRQAFQESPDWAQIHSPDVEKQCIPTISAWQLNERMYGALQGLNKDEARKEFGKEQVEIWRRSYDGIPPEGESLEMTTKRMLPYFEQTMLPHLKQGKNMLVVAHGNSLRAMVMQIEQLSKEEIIKREIPTGQPFTYTYENGQFHKGSL